MTDEAVEGAALSRASNHLGNLANDLKDLGGGASLLNELTQNGDDAGAQSVRFTARADALVVWNSAQFSECGNDDPPPCAWKLEGRRSCDLHSFRDVSGRNKEADAETTGAFGIGFTAVYQVSDHPELVINGRHLILDEAAAEDRRIAICAGGCTRPHDSGGTTLILPWATSETLLRRELGVDALTQHDIEEFVDELHGAATQAVLFLRNVSSLRVESLGRATSVTREADGDRIVVATDGREEEWLLVEGDAANAVQLKERYDSIPSERSPRVQVAFPVDRAVIGRVYAGLPTEMLTGWNGHLNGTFFPRRDRKGVEFDGASHRVRWNAMLVEAAARTIAEHLEAISAVVGVESVWDYLVQVEDVGQGIATRLYPECFEQFRLAARTTASTALIARTVEHEVVTPTDCVLPGAPEDYAAAASLSALGLKVLDTPLRSAAFRLPADYGTVRLSIRHLVDALTGAGLVDPWTPGTDGATPGLDMAELLILVQRMQQRGRNLLADSGIERVAVVPCIDGSFAPAVGTALLPEHDRALFELLDPTLKIVDETSLRELCPSLIALCDDITPLRAVEIFERDLEALAAAPSEVLDWIADHRAALTDVDLAHRLAALPVFPSADGAFRPLTELSLPSSFDDPLGVAGLVDTARADGFKDLLVRLGCRELDVVEYLRRHVLPAVRGSAITRSQFVSVLEIIARERLTLDSEQELRLELATAPMIPCHDGVTRPPTHVHLGSPALTLIAPDAATADVSGLSSPLVETLAWLGVSATPNHQAINDAALRLASQDGDPDTTVVSAILGALPDPLPAGIPATLDHLRTQPWMPIEGGGRARPGDLFAIYRREVFESQGPKLGLPRSDQNKLADQLSWLGVHANPTTTMVIDHLRHCAATNTAMSPQVYRTLGETRGQEDAVRKLAGEACVQVRPGHFVEPQFVFWQDQSLGRWAHVLTPDYRQFQPFFDLVQVRERPNPAGVESLLRGMTRKLGNDILDEEDRAVVHRCWELLDHGLGAPGTRSAAEEALANLAHIRSVVDSRGVLACPDQLLFLDGRRLAERMTLLKNNLVRRHPDTEAALQAAGVRPAEDIIEIVLDDKQRAESAPDLAALVEERGPALRRLFASAESADPSTDVGRALRTRFERSHDLRVQYRATFAGQVQVTPFEEEEAAYLSDAGRLVVRSVRPSRALARELVRCVAPRSDVGAIASSLFEILSQPTLGDAMLVLNEYGVQDLDDSAVERIPSNEVASDALDPVLECVDDMDDADVDADRPEGEAGAPGSAGQARPRPHAGQDEKARPSGGRRKATQGSQQQTRRTRLVSYVMLDDGTDGDGDTDLGDAETSEIDGAGVARVLAFERLCGRAPEEQDHSNPGFDVISRGHSGEILRWIEVKSLRGPWNERGVFLSRTQMAFSQERGQQFWLYVVEFAEDDDAFRIHRIQDPWSQASRFGIDNGWQGVAEPDLERDPAGAPLVAATRGLLGWRSGDVLPRQASTD
jgi:hypothetical protein